MNAASGRLSSEPARWELEPPTSLVSLTPGPASELTKEQRAHAPALSTIGTEAESVSTEIWIAKPAATDSAVNSASVHGDCDANAKRDEVTQLVPGDHVAERVAKSAWPLV